MTWSISAGADSDASYDHYRTDPLRAEPIADVVAWKTRLRPATALYAPLAGPLNMLAVEQVILRSAVDCALSDQPITELALMRGLFAAAD